MKPPQREVASNEISEIYPERLPERKRLHDCRQEFYWNDEGLTQAK
jgi:hypothetical protein